VCQVRLAGIRAHVEAGFDEVYIGPAGGEHDGFFDFYASTVLPRLREGQPSGPGGRTADQ
jgi:hypothetical protein